MEKLFLYIVWENERFGRHPFVGMGYIRLWQLTLAVLSSMRWYNKLGIHILSLFFINSHILFNIYSAKKKGFLWFSFDSNKKPFYLQIVKKVNYQIKEHQLLLVIAVLKNIPLLLERQRERGIKCTTQKKIHKDRKYSTIVLLLLGRCLLGRAFSGVS